MRHELRNAGHHCVRRDHNNVTRGTAIRRRQSQNLFCRCLKKCGMKKLSIPNQFIIIITKIDMSPVIGNRNVECVGGKLTKCKYASSIL